MYGTRAQRLATKTIDRVITLNQIHRQAPRPGLYAWVEEACLIAGRSMPASNDGTPICQRWPNSYAAAVPLSLRDFCAVHESAIGAILPSKLGRMNGRLPPNRDSRCRGAE
jgi:hypothetical protein